MTLTTEYSNKTIQDFVLLYQHGQLNLEPSFQRDSVWSPSDRKKLIISILQNYPIPSVFLYKNNRKGKLVYDVIDGKQRLESILMFQGVGEFQEMRFPVRMRLDEEAGILDLDWRKILRKQQGLLMLYYKIQTVEVSGEFSDIAELFVRINSTGKRLTSAETRHANYYKSDFLRQAGKLAKRYERYFLQSRILSRGQVSRMKHVELVCELMASIHTGGPINKKKSLDAIIDGQTINGRLLDRCVHEFVHTINIVKRMFPDLRTTRFANAVDFYSLFMIVWEMDKQGCILTNSGRNRQAQKLLIWLSKGVDEVRQQVRKAEGAKPEQRLFANYLLTVQGDTDSQATRKRRADILRDVLGGLFAKKDSQRGFTVEQRRLIWHSDRNKRCIECGEPLTWNNFTIDHIESHARGGRTTLSNAALMCRKCNARKGAR